MWAACDYTRGVVFHQGNATNGNSSDLLDMSPSTSSRLVVLLPSQSWTDSAAPNGGVTFEVVSIASSGAVVKITYGSVPPPPPTDIKLTSVLSKQLKSTLCFSHVLIDSKMAF